MIELGLSRITRLLRDTPISWRAMHVAGTNGKGSVCAYASSMLTAARIKCGRFTSPHLMDRWDCISIDENIVDESLFHEVEAMFHTKNENENIKASEFEVLTATAFEIFNREKIEVGVIEVGLGGRHDATNVLFAPSVTVITRIDKDHQSFLGNTLEAIAYQKAGIMKRDVPCVVDDSNEPDVLTVLEGYAQVVKAPFHRISPTGCSLHNPIWSVLSKDSFETHQKANICLAFEGVKIVLAQGYPLVEPWHLLPSVQRTLWKGRLQSLSIETLTGRTHPVLIDGAHNAQSATMLGLYVDRRLRQKSYPVTWVIAVSKGKDAQELLQCLVRHGDHLISVAFSPVDGMPWISPQDPKTILGAGQKLGLLGRIQDVPGRLDSALRLATQVAECNPIVIAGSLYLVSDVFRLLRQVGQTVR